MSVQPILVASHERSGTHFLIDALRLNLKGASFPFVRPSTPALENLTLPHDKDILEQLKAHAAGGQGRFPIFKTHLLPSEIQGALSLQGFLTDNEKKFLEHIYDKALKVYIHRDGRDVMVSLYHFMRQGGGLHLGLSSRLEQMSFQEFIRIPNYHIHTVRSFQTFDANPVSYWRHHVQEWTSLEDVTSVSYEALHGDLHQTLTWLSQQLHLEDHLATRIRVVPLRKGNKYPLMARIMKRLGLLDQRPTLVASTAVAPRKGIVGDWQNYFGPEDLEFFVDNAGDQAMRLTGVK